MSFKGIKAALAAACACLAIAAPAAVHAAETLQVTAASNPRGVTVAAYDPIGQSFTAFTDTLTSFGFEFTSFNPDANSPLTFSLFSGETLTGSALFTQAFTLPASITSRDTSAWVDIALPDLAVTNGAIYTAVLTATSNRAALLTGPGFISQTGQFTGGEAYTGGRLLTNASFIYDNCKGAANNCDANFRVTGDLVPGAVPEPSTWALMILGFGAVGATLRRRQTRAAFA